MTNDCLCSLCL